MPAGRFVRTVRAVYIFFMLIVCARWQVWHCSWCAVRSCLRSVWDFMKWIRRSCFARHSASLPVIAPAIHQTTLPNGKTQEMPQLPHASQVVSKSAMMESTVSTPSESSMIGTSGERTSDTRVCCQSHLTRWNGRDGPSMADTPCKGKRVRSTGFLAVDTLTQNGCLLANDSHSMGDGLLSRHRQVYSGGMAEIKCRNDGCLGAGIPLANRGRSTWSVNTICRNVWADTILLGRAMCWGNAGEVAKWALRLRDHRWIQRSSHQETIMLIKERFSRTGMIAAQTNRAKIHPPPRAEICLSCANRPMGNLRLNICDARVQHLRDRNRRERL